MHYYVIMNHESGEYEIIERAPGEGEPDRHILNEHLLTTRQSAEVFVRSLRRARVEAVQIH